MATLPGSNSSISLAEIQNEFGRGNNLGAYRGTNWFTDDNTQGSFPASPNPISFADFRSKRKTNPVTPYNRVITADEIFTVPVFNTITITVRGPGGGGMGYRGVPWGNPGGDGANGGTTSFGDYASAAGGGGGHYGVGGYVSGAGDGAAGGHGDGPGGAGAKSVISWTVTKASDKAHFGEKIQVIIGKGGAGGAGGVNFGNLGQGWFPMGNNSSGGTGANGSVTIEVT